VILGRPYLPDGSRLIIHRARPREYAPFEEHHYLPGHVVGTRCYLAAHRGTDVAWISTINSVGNGISRVHRLVVLPEARGLGIGRLLATWVAEYEGGRVSLRSRETGFVEALLASPGWRASRKKGPSTADELTGKGHTVDAITAVYASEASHCEGCGVTLSGRSHRRFCSGRCRTAAYRARRQAA
jgi:GNAT superfamily N-acetyltransferase